MLKYLYIFKEDEKEGGQIVVRNTCENGWTILNEYRKKRDTQFSQVTAMMFDPLPEPARHEHAGSEDEWIPKSKQLKRI